MKYPAMKHVAAPDRTNATLDVIHALSAIGRFTALFVART